MHEVDNHQLYSDKVFQAVIRKISYYRYVIIGSMLAGLLAYTFLFTNKLPNHDDLYSMFSKGATIESGRWGLILLSLLFPDYSMPWIYGVVSLVLLTIGNCIVVHIFNIKSKVLQLLIGGIIITFPSQIGTFAYMFTASSYAICYCLSVMAVMYVRTGKIKAYIVAALCMVASVSIYQAYISVTVSLLIVSLIYDLATEKCKAREVFCRGLVYVAYLVVSLAVYWGLTGILWKTTGTGLGTYASDALEFNIASILDGVKNAYVDFYRILRYREHYLIPTTFSHYIHFICFGLIGVELLFYFIRTRDIFRILLNAFLFALLPLGINCMHIFVAESSIHTLMMLPYTALYLIFSVLIESGQKQPLVGVADKIRKIGKELIVIGMAAIIACNIYTANEAYLNMHLAYENTYSLTTTVMANLQCMPEFNAESKVALIGKYERPSYYEVYFPGYKQFMGVQGIAPDVDAKDRFFEYYNGNKLNWASREVCEEIAKNSDFLEMPVYPDYGYIKIIDGIFVIKLSEDT